MTSSPLARLLPIVLVLAVFVVTVVVLRDGHEGYTVRLDLGNANGLREGSQVEVGGRKVGEIATLDVNERGRVVAVAELDDGVRVGRGASAAITAKNLLGEKSLQLRVGSLEPPLPSGSAIPGSRIERSVDLDQVLQVLEPDTRARLGILINESGRTVLGRKQDLTSFLRILGPTLTSASTLVNDLVNDNRTLGRLVDRSDRFVAAFAAERKTVGDFVDRAGQAAETVSARRAALRDALAQTPPTLDRLDGALNRLERATVPIGPAARSISSTAAPLVRTLTALPTFQRSATGTLAQATKVAPRLEELGRRATPVLEESRPVIRALAATAQDARPVSELLAVTVDDLLATLQGWARAIQARDGLSHMFRAKVVVGADSLRTLIGGVGGEGRGKPSAPKRASGGGAAPAAPATAPSGAPKPARNPTPNSVLPSVKLPPLPSVKLPPLTTLPKTTDKPGEDGSALLDFLLGP